MALNKDHIKSLLNKLDELPPERVVEVEDFVDFLRQRDTGQALVHAATRASEPVFRKIWDNPDDAVYNQL